MVVDSDTIIYPGTVVIEAFNTSIAHGTVFAATGADCKTVSTQLRAFYYF